MCFLEAFQSCRVTFLEWALLAHVTVGVLPIPCGIGELYTVRIINMWEERMCDNFSVAFRVVCLHVQSFALLVQLSTCQYRHISHSYSVKWQPTIVIPLVLLSLIILSMNFLFLHYRALSAHTQRTVAMTTVQATGNECMF